MAGCRVAWRCLRAASLAPRTARATRHRCRSRGSPSCSMSTWPPPPPCRFVCVDGRAPGFSKRERKQAACTGMCSRLNRDRETPLYSGSVLRPLRLYPSWPTRASAASDTAHNPQVQACTASAYPPAPVLLHTRPKLRRAHPNPAAAMRAHHIAGVLQRDDNVP